MKHSVAADAAFLREHQNVSDGVLELKHDSLVHLQVNALLDECGVPTRLSEQAVMWASSISDVLEHEMPALSNSALNEAHQTAPWNRGATKTAKRGTNPLFHDDDDDDENKSSGHSIRVLYPSKHLWDAEPSLLLKASTNAHVLPTVERTVLLPSSLWDAHDYRKGRYFEVRGLCFWKS